MRVQSVSTRVVLAALCLAVVLVEAGKKRGKKGEEPVSPYPDMAKVQDDVTAWAANPMVRLWAAEAEPQRIDANRFEQH